MALQDDRYHHDSADLFAPNDEQYGFVTVGETNISWRSPALTGSRRQRERWHAADTSPQSSVRARLAVNPLYIQYRGLQIIFVLLALACALMPKYTGWAILVISLALIAWGSTCYVDAGLRGRTLVDLRLAALSILGGLGLLGMSVLGLLNI
jgi:hypothetical protein